MSVRGSGIITLTGGTNIGGIPGIWPSVVNVICPPHIHILQHVRVSAGCPCTSTIGFPGIQGVVTAGMQGIGVNAPMAAAVAAATVGLEGVVHIPKGMMFTIGAKSMMLPLGTLLNILVRTGSTTSDEGAIPNVHIIIAPVTTYESAIYC